MPARPPLSRCGGIRCRVRRLGRCTVLGGSEQQWWRGRATQPAAGGRTSLRTGSLPAGDPRGHPASPGRPHSRPGHCPTTTQDDGQVQADASTGPSASPARPAPGSDSGRRGGHGHGGRPRRPQPSQPYAGLPTPHSTTSPRSDTADAGTHGHQTPDTRTLRRPHRTPDTGHVDRHAWTLDADTGH